MLFELNNSDTREIAKTLVRLRDNGSQTTTSRVLTLIVVANENDDIEFITRATNDASREHPSRVIVLIKGDQEAPSRLDAKIRVGGDAGAIEKIIITLHGEVSENLVHVVTPLLLPDTPIVVWWPFAAPVNPAADELGRIAQRRITDSGLDPAEDALYSRRNFFTPGDSDLAWARITPWRGVLASALDQPPFEPIEAVRIYGEIESPSVDLAAGWLRQRLDVEVRRYTSPQNYSLGSPVHRVELQRSSGTVTLSATQDPETLELIIPGREPAMVALSDRSAADCLAEELRHLDPDVAYAKALDGMAHVFYPDA